MTWAPTVTTAKMKAPHHAHDRRLFAVTNRTAMLPGEELMLDMHVAR